ncbi:hypothetical protein CGLO_12861 [Colletotrichum gloeosporioides Cg-14]|nr:hypothetical protein CGLO_12861 [Colletotrichum gloeosporioides Cg-14]
MSHKNPL